MQSISITEILIFI